MRVNESCAQIQKRIFIDLNLKRRQCFHYSILQLRSKGLHYSILHLSLYLVSSRLVSTQMTSADCSFTENKTAKKRTDVYTKFGQLNQNSSKLLTINRNDFAIYSTDKH